MKELKFSSFSFTVLNSLLYVRAMGLSVIVTIAGTSDRCLWRACPVPGSVLVDGSLGD